MQQITEVFEKALGSIPFEQLLRDFMLYSTKEPWFFTEFSFLFIFGIFLFFYAILFTQNALRKVYLIAFSLFFYYKSSGPFLGLFLFQILVDYFFARKIERKEGSAKQVWTSIAVLFSLSFLLYFKYANFLIENGFTNGKSKHIRQKISYTLRNKKINNGHNGSVRKTAYNHYWNIIN
jgi:hypothetical protein